MSIPAGGCTDWSPGAIASWNALTRRIAFLHTDITGSDSIAAGATPDIVEDAAIVSLTATF